MLRMTRAMNPPRTTMDRRTPSSDPMAAVEAGDDVKCPVCGETISLADKKAAIGHMRKDAAHRTHLQRAAAETTLDLMVRSGIMRRTRAC